MDGIYSVGQVARLAGVTVRTLHHYDEIGPLPPSGRAANGYRTYTDVDVARLQRIERLEAVAETVRKAMEAHAMGIRLSPQEMLEVFGPDDPTGHAAEAERRWGETDAYRESARRTSSYGKDDWLAVRREAAEVTESFAAAMRAGRPADSTEARAAARAHGEHISRWFYDLSPETHRGLAEVYVADDRFMRNYDDVEPGLAQYVRDAIVALYSSSSE